MTEQVKTYALDFYSNRDKFEFIQTVAHSLSESTMVPAQYQGNKGKANCIIALEMAHRINMSPFMVMQNLYVVAGRPSWSSTFLIAAINTCGKFAPLKFRLEGEGMSRSCVAYTTDKSGEVLESPTVTMKMAQDEGWLNKNGSKWKTMPDLMLRYRSASFFSRLYAPEIAMGMNTVEEVIDVVDVAPSEVTLGTQDLSRIVQPIDEKVNEELEKLNVEAAQIIEDNVPEETPEPPQEEPKVEQAIVEQLGDTEVTKPNLAKLDFKDIDSVVVAIGQLKTKQDKKEFQIYYKEQLKGLTGDNYNKVAKAFKNLALKD